MVKNKKGAWSQDPPFQSLINTKCSLAAGGSKVEKEYMYISSGDHPTVNQVSPVNKKY